jgi:hypothetical protein
MTSYTAGCGQCEPIGASNALVRDRTLNSRQLYFVWHFDSLCHQMQRMFPGTVGPNTRYKRPAIDASAEPLLDARGSPVGEKH